MFAIKAIQINRIPNPSVVKLSDGFVPQKAACSTDLAKTANPLFKKFSFGPFLFQKKRTKNPSF